MDRSLYQVLLRKILALQDRVGVVAAGGGGGSGITQLTGDVTAGPGTGSQAATLATSGVSAGTYGSGTQVAQVTFDAKGRATAAVNVTITPSGDTSGGSTPYQVQTTTLTHAQILALGTTPITLVSAGASGKVRIPVQIITVTDFAAGAYSNPTVNYRYAGSSVDLVPASSNLINNADKRFQLLNATDYAMVNSVGDAKAVQISTGVGVTGGNAANTWKITVIFVELSLL